MSKKSLLADLLFNRLKYVSEPICKAFKKNGLYLLAYHRILPLTGSDYPFLDGIVSASPESFEEQLRFVKSRFNVTNFNDLSDRISAGGAVPGNSLIITFDDGYADNYDVAFELLKRHGLTATMFVSTGFVDSGRPLWFDRSAYIIKAVPEGSISFDSGRYRFDVTKENRQQVITSVRDLFVAHSNEDRLRWLDELEELSGVRFSPEHLNLVKALSWDQIKEMSDNGIEIGSHTVTHPYLTSLSDETLEFELAQSKKAIEEHTGKKVKSVAYPSGAFDGKVQQCARECGYQFGIAYDHDVRKLTKENSFAIPRVHVEIDVGFSLFKANLLFPQLFVR